MFTEEYTFFFIRETFSAQFLTSSDIFSPKRNGFRRKQDQNAQPNCVTSEQFTSDMRSRRAFVRAFGRYQLKGVMQHARLLTPRGVFSRNDCKMKLCLTSADKHERGKYAPGRIFEKAFNNTPRGAYLRETPVIATLSSAVGIWGGNG